MASWTKLAARAGGWLCALSVLICVVLMDPRAEMGMHDDFSYIYSAKVLAETGHLVYNGWAAFPLGWFVYLGAFFIKVFGFSFMAPRAATVFLAMATAGLMYTLLRRLGVRRWNAIAGTLTFVLSPVFLPLAASFMSDVPGVLCIAVCLYGCVRAVQAETDAGAVAWLLFAAATNLVGGTMRQIVWLGVLVMVPSTAVFLRRRRGVLIAGAAAWVVSAALILWMIRWFNHQPYAVVEKLVALDLTPLGLLGRCHLLIKCVFTMLFLMFPVLLGLAVVYRAKVKTTRRATAVAIAIVVFVGVFSIRHGGAHWTYIFLLGNYLGAKGVLFLKWTLGETPDLIPRPVAALMTLSVSLVSAVCTEMLWEAWPTIWARMKKEPLAWMLGPFSVASVVLIVTRFSIFDRYLLPLEFVLLVAVLVLHQRRSGRRLSGWYTVPLVLLAFYGVAGTHDLFVITRARLAAANEIRAAGVPRSEIGAGFEYDGWTQIDLTGHMNDSRIHVPAGAYHPWTVPAGERPECILWTEEYTPSIHPRYTLSTEPNSCGPSGDFAPVPYRGWLHGERAIYILRMR